MAIWGRGRSTCGRGGRSRSGPIRVVASCRQLVHQVGVTTSEEPTGSLLTTCGNRRASRCPARPRIYAADTYHLIRAGLSGGKTVPDTVRTHPRVFATLTPPSFGPVHNRPTTPGGGIRPCRCRKLHEPTTPCWARR
ncbi:replication initiator [Streptomyces sp. NBC_00562]|uniref:replication initiator n=1 Tax=Streptomyces sp. NBC_00562 TaxID=2975777 RepID=UPI003FCD3B9F